MLVLYNSNTTAFSNLGLGILKDLKGDAIITEELNGSFILEFEYTKNGFLSDKLLEGNLIKCNNQVFRIKNITKSLSDSDSINILAQQFFQFDMSKNFLVDVAPTKLNGQNALRWVIDRAEIPTNFTINGDCTELSSARYVRKNVSDAIYNVDNSLLSRFGGELEFNLSNVYLHNKRGSDKGFSIRYRKNLKGLEFNLDFSTVVTKICPQGANELLLDELYVSSPKINNYYQPFFQKMEFTDIGVDEETTEEEAKNKLKEAALEQFNQGIDVPEISIKVDFVELSKCTEYQEYQNLESCTLGDTIKVIIPEFNINTSVRVVKTVYNDNLKRLTSLELGTTAKNIVSSQNIAIKNIENTIENPVNILASAKKEATEMINHPFKGNLVIDEETGVLYLIDTNDIKTAKNVWKWSMGGLGFSSTGINGTFNTAITQDGSIVADFIKTGKINTSLIDGYDSLLLDVSKIRDVTRTITANNYIEITDSVYNGLLYFSIKGSASLTFPSNQTFLGNNTYFKTSKIIIEDISGNKKEIETNIKILNALNNTYDEFIVDNTGTYIIRRIGESKDSSLYLLDKEVKEELSPIKIELNEGYNKIYMESFSTLNYSLKYAKKNEYTDNFATKLEMNSSIALSEENINLKLAKKTDSDNIIAQINMSTEKDNDGSFIQIEADKLNLKGKKINLTSDEIDIESDKFKVTKEGQVTCEDININSGKIDLTDDSQNPSLTMKSLISTGGETSEISSMKLLGNGMNIQMSSNVYLLAYMHRGLPAVLMSDGTNFTSIFSSGITTPVLTQTSLEESKKNFEKLENALEEIKKTDIYKYNLKSESDNHKKHLGFVIGEKYNFSHLITAVDENGKEIGVDSYSMTSLCLQAIKEQQEVIEKLEEKIRVLEEKINGNND